MKKKKCCKTIQTTSSFDWWIQFAHLLSIDMQCKQSSSLLQNIKVSLSIKSSKYFCSLLHRFKLQTYRIRKIHVELIQIFDRHSFALIFGVFFFRTRLFMEMHFCLLFSFLMHTHRERESGRGRHFLIVGDTASRPQQ